MRFFVIVYLRCLFGRRQTNFQLNGSIRPVPPPRDHLRIEKDGRLVNRAPAPQVPDRNHQLQNNQIAQVIEPTTEQLDSIKKYQVRKTKNSFPFFTSPPLGRCFGIKSNRIRRRIRTSFSK